MVAVVGARQVGKSTVLRALPGRHYVTLDDLGALSAATADPQGFVERLPIPATIDEIQRVPELLLAIKATVDHERRPGAFLITGSSRLDTLPGHPGLPGRQGRAPDPAADDTPGAVGRAGRGPDRPALRMR